MSYIPFTDDEIKTLTANHFAMQNDNTAVDGPVKITKTTLGYNVSMWDDDGGYWYDSDIYPTLHSAIFG